MIANLKSYFAQICKLSKCADNKGVCRQIAEVVLLLGKSRLGPGFYLKAKFYRKDTSLRHILGFHSLRGYKKQVGRLNDRLYHRCSQNKVVEKSLLQTFQLPTPKFLGYLNADRGLTANGKPLRNDQDWHQFLNTFQIGNKLCFKLLDSWGGKGFHVFLLESGTSLINVEDGKSWSHKSCYEYLLSLSRDGLIIEEYMEQHDEYAKYNPSSVNTYRVLVKKRDMNAPEVLGGYLRVGRAGALVDNGTAGGIIFPFDCESGVISTGFLVNDRQQEFDCHPDNGVQIAGTKLSFYVEGLELAKEALLAFPETNFAGVDIAFSQDGPVVIELNVLPDYNGFANLSLPSIDALSTNRK